MTAAPREDLVRESVVHPNGPAPARVGPPPLDQRFVESPGSRPAASSTVGFGLDGRETADESRMAAKRVSTGDEARFFIRHDAGRPLDPGGVSFKLDDFLGGRKHRGRTRYEFREAGAQAFALYCKYLCTRSAALIAEVERLQNA